MNKGLSIIVVALLLALIFLNWGTLSFWGKRFLLPFQSKNSGIANLGSSSKGCLIKTEEMTVRGDSLAPFIKSGQTVQALFGYYNCHKIKRGDVVLFKYAGDKNLLIKMVKGIPGDKFELRKTEGGWNIIVNNQIVKNAEGKPYLIFGNAYKMLSLYERDYKGIIPENAYLLLGNKVSGSVDSTTFGLVDKSGIRAKVKI